ncbi:MULTISPECIES: ABC transporter permease [unclassified Bradyrhizobium]|uniref:ABC transporter permease n=1 Tax=unclassified Bradyrhizobium TaxID=2631580 RepID=UPI0028E4EF40|nr:MULTISPECIES: ABC transporter permease [unclassified Bradyrhizobium]
MTELFGRMIRKPQGAISVMLLVALAIVCILGPWLAPYGPEKMDFLGRFRPPGWQNWLGADQFGRDVLSRLLSGARATVPMALAATLAGSAMGAVIGVASAYLGGKADEFIMRTNDAVMAIPGLLMALLLVSTLGNGAVNAVIAIGFAFAPGMARVTRSVALAVRNQDYVKAAIARGEAASQIIFREMLPNVMGPIIIEATIRVSFAVMLFATLSFLGLGAQPPASEWGLMVADARQYMHQAPWILIAPSAAIALSAIAFNLVGDALRDALHPRDDR